MLFSKHIYVVILAYILLILAISGAGMWMILSKTGIIIGGLLILCSFFLIGALTHRLNTFNRKIRLFFDAVQDKENILHWELPATENDKNVPVFDILLLFVAVNC